jgi:hypothetical protein
MMTLFRYTGDGQLILYPWGIVIFWLIALIIGNRA